MKVYPNKLLKNLCRKPRKYGKEGKMVYLVGEQRKSRWENQHLQNP
jgi:hypothetical protein